MMDTILNLGLNEEVVEIIKRKTGNERWARDCYRRFIQMFSDVVMEVGKKYFEELIDRMKAARGVTQDVELTSRRPQRACRTVQGRIKKKSVRTSRGSEGTADGRDQSRLSFLGQSTRECLSPGQRYSVLLGHRGQRTGNGVRQLVRRIRHRRRLYPRSGDRRKEADGRIPSERAG